MPQFYRLQTLSASKTQTKRAKRRGDKVDKTAFLSFEDVLFHRGGGRVLPNTQLLLLMALVHYALGWTCELHYPCS